MLKTAVLLNIFVETDAFFQDYLINRKFKITEFITNRKLCNIINVSLLDNLLHPCWIKVFIYFLKNPLK